MVCRTAQLELVGYHFGALALEEREALENHLCACGACLQSYILLKRNVELGAGVDFVPSGASRLKLRGAVASHFEKKLTVRARKVLFIPVPLYQVAAALLLVGLAVFSVKSLREEDGTSEPKLGSIAVTAPDSANRDLVPSPHTTAFDGSNAVAESANYL